MDTQHLQDCAMHLQILSEKMDNWWPLKPSTVKNLLLANAPLPMKLILLLSRISFSSNSKLDMSSSSILRMALCVSIRVFTSGSISVGTAVRPSFSLFTSVRPSKSVREIANITTVLPSHTILNIFESYITKTEVAMRPPTAKNAS